MAIFNAFIAKITGAASSGDEATTTAVRPLYADGARSLVSVLSIPFQLALSKINVVLLALVFARRVDVVKDSPCRRGLAGIDGDLDPDPDGGVFLTTIVSTIPITRTASVNNGPSPLFNVANIRLCFARAAYDSPGSKYAPPNQRWLSKLSKPAGLFGCLSMTAN